MIADWTGIRKMMGRLSGKTANRPTPTVYDLVIFDDCYPHPMSGFRVEEFNAILSHVDNSKAVLSGSVYAHYHQPPGAHARHVAEVSGSRPHIAHKLFFGDGNSIDRCRLFYCVFLNNILKVLPELERKAIPFVFTLYPGGGFRTGDPETDRLLRIVFSSPCFRKVIVTQRRTYDYLVDRKFCRPADIEFIFGVVVPQESMQDTGIPRKYFPTDKETFDLCFCAMRYTPTGEDKGYPHFIGLMKAVSGKYRYLRFHVIGNFDDTVIDLSGYEDRIVFHGPQDFHGLRDLFREMDMILSPNQPDKLAEGAFDGFPLGTVVEAALNGVAVMLSDECGENRYFENGRELLIVKPDVDEMTRVLENGLRNTEALYRMAEAGQARFRQMYAHATQLAPRIRLLESLLTAPGEK